MSLSETSHKNCRIANRGIIFIITEINSTYVYRFHIRISHCLEWRIGDTLQKYLYPYEIL